ncbi:MAG: YggT family protein [Gammaproteobacteria bacterium]|nr:YggT family protein [Gammaproteobacteria bacterium]
MQNALTFLVSALLDIYIIAFFLRLALGWVRADYRNPLAQFVVKVTNPLVIPARRFIPSLGGMDLATVVVLVALQLLATGLLVQIACADATVGQVVVLGLMRLVTLVLNLYFWLLIVWVIASWVSPGGYNPALAVLGAMLEPLLAPLRRVIPPVAGFDLSPIFVFLAIGFVQRLLPSGQALSGLFCAAF